MSGSTLTVEPDFTLDGKRSACGEERPKNKRFDAGRAFGGDSDSRDIGFAGDAETFSPEGKGGRGGSDQYASCHSDGGKIVSRGHG